MSQSAYVSRQVISKTGFREGTKPLLSRLDIELTERCNNNCLHCYINLPQDDLEAKNKELSTDEIKNILKEAVSLGCLTERFTGVSFCPQAGLKGSALYQCHPDYSSFGGVVFPYSAFREN